jgi:hypothetical protein
MNNLWGALIIIATYVLWGLFLIEQRWWREGDLNLKHFSLSLIPTAIFTWLGLYVAGL